MITSRFYKSINQEEETVYLSKNLAIFSNLGIQGFY